jgi:hypothetical protein
VSLIVIPCVTKTNGSGQSMFFIKGSCGWESLVLCTGHSNISPGNYKHYSVFMCIHHLIRYLLGEPI